MTEDNKSASFKPGLYSWAGTFAAQFIQTIVANLANKGMIEDALTEKDSRQELVFGCAELADELVREMCRRGWMKEREDHSWDDEELAQVGLTKPKEDADQGGVAT